MRRAAPALLVSPKMFRHFAVLTVVITSMLALFADGENRKVMADTIEEQQAKHHAQQVEHDKLGAREIGKRPRSQADGGGEAPVDAAAPAAAAGYDPSGTGDSEFGDFTGKDAPPPRAPVAPNLPRPAAVDPHGNPIMGASPKLNPRKAGPVQNGPKRPGRASRQQMEAMLAASRARSSRPNAGAGDDEAETEE